LVSLVMLDHQKNPLMRTDVKRREIWEWSDHTPGRFPFLPVRLSMLAASRPRAFYPPIAGYGYPLKAGHRYTTMVSGL
jgi:hypothetical protein